MRLGDLNRVFKIYWAVTFNLKLLVVRAPNHATFAHVDEAREKLVLLWVDNGEGVDGDQDFVTFAMDADRVIIVVVLVGCRSKLNVNILRHACRQHAFFVVPYFEIGSLRRQNVKPLRSWRIVKNSQFHRVCFVHLKARKLDNTGHGCEEAIGAHGVILISLCERMSFISLSFSNKSPLQFNLIWFGGRFDASVSFLSTSSRLKIVYWIQTRVEAAMIGVTCFTEHSILHWSGSYLAVANIVSLQLILLMTCLLTGVRVQANWLLCLDHFLCLIQQLI